MPADWLHPETFTVPTADGDLTVARWGDSGPVVLGIHGNTASHMEWPYLARELGDAITFIAPDLRGRGGSRDVGPPYGIKIHADDCIAILDHLEVDKAVVVGHSHGGFVAALLAMHYPERLSNLVLVDGGIPFGVVPPPDADIEMILNVLLGPSIQRCSMKFASLEEYISFWKEHPSVQDEGAWNEVFEAYVVYDLMGDAPELHSKVNLDSIFGDGRDAIQDEDLQVAIDKITCPILFVRAPRGILNQPVGLYSDELAAELVAQHDNLTDVLIDDVNHFTLVISERGSRELATHIRPLIPQDA